MAEERSAFPIQGYGWMAAPKVAGGVAGRQAEGRADRRSSENRRFRKRERAPSRDCTGCPFLGFLGFGLFGKITRVLGRVFGLLLVREKELICEKAYISISHFKAYDCYT